ncbi:MAG TPA: OmpP1/FadL family transporter [Gammaproteobacteria bacterium]|nr:OmpP1/FadL family transporter [Gammaproteobacteria bacterium]
MPSLRRLLVPAASLSLLIPAAASASGFRLPESSIAGLGTANALVANTTELGALSYNPAAMSFHDGQGIAVGLIAVDPDISVTPSEGPSTGIKVKSQGDTRYLPSLIYSNRLTNRWSVGVNVNSPFGLETKWPRYTFIGPGGKKGFEPEHTKIEMLNINPNVAYKLGSNTSVAVGLNYYDLRDVVFNTHLIKINGDGADWGWNLGLQHVAGPWSFGASYRSKVKVDVDGSIDGTAAGYGTSSAKSSIEFPDMLQLGARYQVNPRLALELDYERTGWSSFDKLEIQQTAVPFPIVSTNNWEDSNTYRLGGTYQLTPKTQLRFGYAYDETPQPDQYFSARVPDANRQLFSIGVAHNIAGWTLEGGYMYVKFDKRTISSGVNFGGLPLLTDPNGTDVYNGTYDSSVNLFGIGVSKKF